MFYSINRNNALRQALIILFFVAGALCQAHPFDGPGGHAYDFRNVLEGCHGEQLDELYKTISGGIDHEFYNIVRQQLGAVHDNHRIIGHWGFEGSIPFNDEPWKSQLAHYPKKKLVGLWQDYTTSLIKTAMAKTGLPEQQAKGLIGLLYNVHLLGDRVYGNVEVNQVIKPDLIIRDIQKNLHRLFGNNSHIVKAISSDISSIPRNAVYASKCDQVIKILYKHDVGQKLFDVYGKELGTHQIRNVKTVAQPLAAKSQYASNGSHKLAQKMTEYVRGNTGKVATPMTKNCKIVNGVLQETTVYGKEALVLSIPIQQGLRAGAYAGVMTFVLCEGVTVYKFARGNITEDEFLRQSVKNMGIGLAVGTATFVAVALGATPTGWIVLGVGIGTAIMVDLAFEYLYKEFTSPIITMDDILGNLPSELQRRATVWEATGFDCLATYNRERLTIFDRLDRESILHVPDRPTVLEPSHRKTILGD